MISQNLKIGMIASRIILVAACLANVTLPASNWTILGPIPEVAPGRYQFTDSNAPAFPMRFYRVLFP